MAGIAQSMLRDALDAFVRRDMQLARQVLNEDDKLDDLKTQIFRELLTYMLQDPSTIEPALELILDLASPRAHRRSRNQHRRGRHLHRVGTRRPASRRHAGRVGLDGQERRDGLEGRLLRTCLPLPPSRPFRSMRSA